MGTQSQTPNTPTQQPNRSPDADDKQQLDRDAETRRSAKGKDEGNVPRSDDDLTDDDSDQGTREDAAGSDAGSKQS